MFLSKLNADREVSIKLIDHSRRFLREAEGKAEIAAAVALVELKVSVHRVFPTRFRMRVNP